MYGILGFKTSQLLGILLSMRKCSLSAYAHFFFVIATISCLPLSTCSRTVHFLLQLQGSFHNSINVRGTLGSYFYWIWLGTHQEKPEPLSLLQLLQSWLPYCIQNWPVYCLTIAVMCVSDTSIIYYQLSPHYWKVNNERLLKRRLFIVRFNDPKWEASTGNCLLADYEMRLRSGLDNLKRVFEPIIVIFFSFLTN